MNRIIVLLFTVIVFLRPPQLAPTCDINQARIAIPPRIFAESAIDGPAQNTYLTRFLHNKIGIFLSGFGKCYFFAFDPNFIAENSFYIGYIFWLYFTYKIIANKNYILLTIFFLSPLIGFFNLSQVMNVYLQRIFAIMGLSILLKVWPKNR